jgi:hypothetical protein
MKIEACGDGLRVSTETIDAQGYRVHRETSFKFDGRDYLLKGSPFADSISAKRINQRASESIWKQSGKAVLTVRTVISVDGRTLNMTRTAVTAGHAAQVDELLVYDRQ